MVFCCSSLSRLTWFTFILCVHIQSPEHHLLKRLALASLLKVIETRDRKFISGLPVLVVYLYLFVIVLHCGNYCRFIEVLKYDTSNFVLFEDYFGYSESLVLPYNFRISLFISEKAVKIFIRIALHFYSILTILSSNLWLNTVILNIFICSVGISFYSESFPQPNTVLLPPISYMLLLAKILHFCIAPTMYYIRIILYYCFLSQLRGGTFPYTSIVS